MIKKVLSAICFLGIVIGLFYASNTVLYEKQHFGTSKNIAHEEAEKIDVFFVGPSHIFYGIDPMEIWKDAGIPAYNLTTHQQPLWASKLLLQYALNRQHPKLIVLDVIMATNFSRPLLGTELGTNMTHLALDPVPLSLQKIKGVLETESITEKGEILLPVIMSHSRLQQGLLTYDDFHFFSGDLSHPTKGFNYTTGVMSFERPASVPDADSVHELPDGLEEVLIDFIEFCSENELPLLLIKTPVVVNEEFYRQVNYIGKIAEKYGVPFLDFNHKYDELGIDFSTDFADSGHLNFRGANKVSAYLAEYLRANYDLPDRRGDESYSSWDQAVKHYDALTGLPDSTDPVEHLKAASDPNLLTVILSGGKMNEPLALPENFVQAMRELGLSDVPDSVDSGTYYAVIRGGRVLSEKRSASEILTEEFMIRDSRFVVRVSPREPDGGSFMTALYIDQGGNSSTEPGMLIVTYDMDRMERVDAVRYAFDDSFAVEHLR